MKFLWVLFFLKLAFGQNDTRIINGINAIRGQFPYIVSIQVRNEHNCGGSILNERFILTAAHCVDRNQQYIIKAGKHNVMIREETEQVSNVARVISHPNYDNRLLCNDIAILEINPPLRLVPGVVESINIPQEGVLQLSFQSAVTSGWGHNGRTPVSPILQTITLPIINLGRCLRIFSNLRLPTPNTIICAGGSGNSACFGDSGGPLICKDSRNSDILCGVTSFGMDCSTEIPGAFTNTALLSNWIRQNSNIQFNNQNFNNNFDYWWNWNLG